MILSNEFNDAEIEEFGIQQSTSQDAEVDSADMSFFYDLVSNQLYSNPIGSITRELTSNCFDAHVAAGISSPVIIKIHSIEYLEYVSFIDFGTGLSVEAMETVYRKYLKSTKRESNEYIGAFGLGSKSPLSYTDMFYIITRVDGIEYFYTFHKLNGKPKLDRLSQKTTEEPNGTEIRVPINTSSTYTDKRKFRAEIKHQLAYFDDVYVLDEEEPFENDYKILEQTYFKFRANNLYSGQMHIVLGKVSYPIDWSVLEEEPINISIGVKFNIGELAVTPSRESIRYDETSKVLIKDRIKESLKELEKLSKGTQVLESIPELIQYNKNISGSSGFTTVVKGFSITVGKRKVYKDRNVTWNYDFVEPFDRPKISVKGFEHINIDFKNINIVNFIKGIYYSDKMISRHTNAIRGVSIDFLELFKNDKVFYRCREDSTGKIKNYSIVTTENKDVYLLKRTSNYFIASSFNALKKAAIIVTKKNSSGRSYSLYSDSLTKLYKELYKAVNQYIVSITKSYDNFEVTPEAREQYKLNNVVIRPIYEGFPVKRLVYVSKIQQDFTINKIRKGELVIYGTKDEKELLEFVNDILQVSNKNKYTDEGVNLIEVSKKHHKALSTMPNSYHVEDFLKKDHKVYKKLVTNLVKHKILETRTFRYGLPKNLLNFLTDYQKTTYLKTKYKLEVERKEVSNKDLEEMILLYAKENNLIDQEELREVEMFLKFEEKFILFNLIDRDGLDKIVKEPYAYQVRKYLKANKILSPVKPLLKDKDNSIINLNNLETKIYGYSEITSS